MHNPALGEGVGEGSWERVGVRVLLLPLPSRERVGVRVFLLPLPSRERVGVRVL